MKRFTLIFGALIASLPAVAQINQTPVHSGGNQIFTTAEKELAVKGTVFIDEKFMPAKLSDSDTPVLVRYNAVDDEFEENNSLKQTTGTLPKTDGQIITFTGSGKAYTLQQYKTDDNEVIDGYLNVISNGKVKIYKRERIFLQEGKQSKNSYQSAKAPEYKRASDEFYVLLPGSTQANFFDGKKDFAKLIPGKEKEVLDYIKTNKLDLEKDADLQKLATFVETLV